MHFSADVLSYSLKPIVGRSKSQNTLYTQGAIIEHVRLTHNWDGNLNFIIETKSSWSLLISKKFLSIFPSTHPSQAQNATDILIPVIELKTVAREKHELFQLEIILFYLACILQIKRKKEILSWN